MNSPKENSETSVQYARLSTRIWANLLDGVVLMPIMLLSLYNLIILKSFTIEALATLLVWCTYKPLMEWRYGATLGKRLVGIKVVTEDFGKISFEQAAVRFSPFFLAHMVNLSSNFRMFQHPEFATSDTLEKFAEFQEYFAKYNTTALHYIASTLLMVSVSFIIFDFIKKQALYDRMARTVCVHSNSLPKA